MIIRNLDENHDWTFGYGLANYLTGDAAIGLNIETRFESWVGDCFFDVQAGIDWWNRLGSKDQRALLDLDSRRLVLTSFGVTQLNSFDSVLTVRDYTSNFDIQTVNSPSYKNAVSQQVAKNG